MRLHHLGSSLLLFLAAPAGCFSGADALGLPCNSDADCGKGQSCLEQFCGGPPATTTDGSTGAQPVCGDGNVDEGEACDDGNDDNEDSCLDTCVAASCGDGFMGPGESCDDGNDNNEDDCTNECALASCGDGNLQEGEECDEGAGNSDGGACTTKCLNAFCGDGSVYVGMEECDDGNTVNDATCLADCGAVWFWDDMETEANANWSSEVVTGALMDQWGRSQAEAASGDFSRFSGTNATDPVSAGSTRLKTAIIDLTDVQGEVELRFNHRWTFDHCPGENPVPADGGILEIYDGSIWGPVVPVGGYPIDPLGNTACTDILKDPSPLAERPGYGGTAPATFVSATVDLSSYAGSSIQVGFQAGWDCADCDAAGGWYIDDVQVSRPLGR